jgi:hypothetical protein
VVWRSRQCIGVVPDEEMLIALQQKRRADSSESTRLSFSFDQLSNYLPEVSTAFQPPQPQLLVAPLSPQPQPLLHWQQGTGHITVTGTCLHTQ